MHDRRRVHCLHYRSPAAPSSSVPVTDKCAQEFRQRIGLPRPCFFFVCVCRALGFCSFYSNHVPPLLDELRAPTPLRKSIVEAGGPALRSNGVFLRFGRPGFG